MKKIKFIISGFILFFSSQLLWSQTINVTGFGGFSVETNEYVNNMYRVWNVNIPGNKTIFLSYSTDIEYDYDNLYIYSINANGTAVLQKTISGYTNGNLTSLFPTGKMRIVFESDGSICGKSGELGNEAGFSFGLFEFRQLQFSYDTWGNRIGRNIYLFNNQSLRSATYEEEETVYRDFVDYETNMVIKEAEVLVYPNPTEGRLAVEINNIPGELNCEIFIMSENGRQVYRNNVKAGEKTEFDLTRENEGLYVLYIRIDKTVSSWKIIKK